MTKIDVFRHVTEMEDALRTGQGRYERINALAILSRWQFDDMLDDQSRARARALVNEFAHADWDEV